MEKYYSKIKNSPLFCGITDEELEKMLKCFGGYVKKYEDGDMIIRQGETISKIYLILDGEVNVEKETYWGRRIIIQKLYANNNIGLALVASKNIEANINAMCVGHALILILNYDAIMALLALCSAPVTLLVSRFLQLKMRRYNQRMRQVSSDVMEFTEESFQNMQYIKSFSITGLFRRRLKGVQKKYYDISMEYNEFSIKTSTLMSVLSMVVSFVCLGWSVARLWTGHITYGTMTMFLQLSRSLAADFNALIKLVPSAISAATSAGRIMEVTELPKETVNRNVVQKLKKEASRGVYIVLEHIVYSYDGEKTVLTGGSFYASPGEIVAITGASGSGKTTLLRIILGLIEIQEGTAFVQTASGFTHSFDASTRTLVSYVPQGNTVFSGTIADNLKMIVPNATEEEMQKALEIACAWEFVSKLPNGMQCQVGENGKGLSEGQSQRIAIARAVLKKAPVIVFDEATSALDERTGRQVIQNIKREYRSCTCILVTHRTSDLDICSKVYRINQGKMVEIHENH